MNIKKRPQGKYKILAIEFKQEADKKKYHSPKETCQAKQIHCTASIPFHRCLHYAKEWNVKYTEDSIACGKFLISYKSVIQNK